MAELDVAGLAHAYRRLVLWFGAQLLVNCASQAGKGMPDDMTRLLFSLVFLAVALATVGALVYYGFRTAQALGSDVAWLWALAMLIPCVNIITLLALSSQATSACRANGVEVGFLGPKI
jgi:hypothetical protein